MNTQKNINILSNKAFLFRFENYQKGKDSNLDEFIDNFKAFQICSEGFYLLNLKLRNIFRIADSSQKA